MKTKSKQRQLSPGATWSANRCPLAPHSYAQLASLLPNDATRCNAGKIGVHLSLYACEWCHFCINTGCVGVCVCVDVHTFLMAVVKRDTHSCQLELLTHFNLHFTTSTATRAIAMQF